MVVNNLVGLLVPPRFKKRDDEDDKDDDNAVAISTEALATDDAPPPPRRRWRCCGFSSTQLALSGASDMSTAADWAFYESMKKNPAIPGFLVSLEWCLVVAATLIYTLQVTEGRLFKRLARRCFGVQLTKKKILDAGVWIEDVPQVAMSVLVQWLYAGSWAGWLNLGTSGFSAYHKLQALFHNDIEEEEEEDLDGTPEEVQPILNV